MPPPVEPPTDIPSLFETERTRLLALLHGLGSDDWARPSPCPGWSVHGLCTHLVGDDLSLLARKRDRYFGTPPPAGASESQFIGWLDQLMINWVDAARRLSPRLVIDLLAWTGPQLVDTFRNEDPRVVAAEVTWAGTDPVPVWLDQVRELSEYWIHRQQILQAIDRPSDLDPDLLGPIFEGFRWAYPFRLSAVDAAVGDVVTIEITGPVAVTWHLVATRDAWEFASPAPTPAAPVATMSLTTEEAWRLLTNNLPSDAQRQLDVSGDPKVVHVLRRTRAIIGAPN